MEETLSYITSKINNISSKLGMKSSTFLGLIFVIIILVFAFSSSGNTTDTPVEVNPIEAQFSAWDGSHINLTRVIKDNMKNPKSFEHISSTYKDMGNYLIVTETYRGTNSFGGVVPESISAKVDLSGNILEILK